jgi:hypothetical protein
MDIENCDNLLQKFRCPLDISESSQLVGVESYTPTAVL